MTPNEFATELSNIYGEKLQAVVLYGSAVHGNHSKKFSDHNIFCVLEKATPSELALSQKLVEKWSKKGNSLPLFFEPDHIKTSLDVFPMEFLDMKNAHKVLLGQDPLKNLSVSLKNLRRQCESELKGKLIHLRSIFALNCSNYKKLNEAVIISFPSFLACMRAILRLHGKEIPIDARAVVEQSAILSGINPEVFFDIIMIRRGESLPPRKIEAVSMFEQYLTELHSISSFVDKLEQNIIQ